MSLNNRNFQSWLDELKLRNPDGTPNWQNIENEMHDFYHILQEVPKVYDHITGGKMSKPNYLAREVIAAADDFFDEMIGLAIEDAKEDQIID